ncbi:MAG TPA: hypothetical protein VGH62_08025 [Bradyrhizobium sp.]|jgi:hypothetical protein
MTHPPHIRDKGFAALGRLSVLPAFAFTDIATVIVGSALAVVGAYLIAAKGAADAGAYVGESSNIGARGRREQALRHRVLCPS